MVIHRYYSLDTLIKVSSSSSSSVKVKCPDPGVASHDQKPDMGTVSGIKSPPLARTPPLSHGIYIDRCISLRYVLLEVADLLAATNYIM